MISGHCSFKPAVRSITFPMLGSSLSASILAAAVFGQSAYAQTAPGQTATRSDYTAGPVSYTHFKIPTQTHLPPDLSNIFQDVNGDGYTDIVVTVISNIDKPRNFGRPGAILLNNGDNTFNFATGDTFTSEWARELLVEDFNGDGIPDMFIADHGWDAFPFPGFQNQLLYGTGTGFVNATHLLPVLDDFSHNAAAGDINGDGRIDLYIANNTFGDANEKNYFLINKGDAGFELNRDWLPPSQLTIETPSWAVEIADMDGDGHADLLIGRIEETWSLPSRIYWNPGNGDFSKAEVTYLPGMRRFVPNGDYAVIEVQAFDLNNDGARDIQLTAYDAKNAFRGLGMQFLFSEGPGTRRFIDRTESCFSGRTQDPSLERDTTYFLRLQDINLDGYPELLAVNNVDQDSGTTAFFENSGGGKFRAITRADLSNDQDVLNRLRWATSPLKSQDEFGFAEAFAYDDDNGVNTLGINYVPFQFTHQPVVANRFDTCSNKLVSAVAAGEFGDIELGFNLLQMEPTVRIQAVESTLRPLSVLPDKASTFTSANGIFRIPELHVDGDLAYRGLQFLLIDGEKLVFELVGSE